MAAAVGRAEVVRMSEAVAEEAAAGPDAAAAAEDDDPVAFLPSCGS